jgi:2-O-(6-phospho-alpha-D-mannosyl)-D-glycerate hydrolase
VKAFYCVGTHWDREWYEPFQEFRMWLVELIDELLDIMEQDEAFCYFHLDGQAVVLQDYLDIRPENRDRFLKLLRDGRIVAGPWYVLPDEWLISGESYVRNMMLGMRACRELGVEPGDFAYTPDQFGHIAALPMLMTGFGLKTGIVWRGTQDETYPAHFVWVGPDGSRMVTHKLMDKGSYSPFGMLVREKIEKDDFSDERLRELFDPLFQEERSRSDVPLVLLLDAIDHQRPPRKMPRLMEELKRCYPDVGFEWSTLPDYGKAMLEHADSLPERSGELREPSRAADRGGQYLIVHTISSRYPIKKRNDECQALLELAAEPCALFQMMDSGAPITRYLDVAWEYLIKNHPHDSICGCSIDQVHRDMGYRFDQCTQIGDGVIRRALAHLGKADGKDEHFDKVVVHNPLPFARKGVFDVAIPFKSDWPKTFVDGLSTGERINKFALVKKDGERLPFQLCAIDRGTTTDRISDCGRWQRGGADVYRLAVEMELPACGHTAFRVEPIDEAVRNFGSQTSMPMAATNGIIGFNLNPNGTGDLFTRANEASYEGLFLYEDSGDCGDGWTRGQVTNDLVFRSAGSRVMTALEEDGPLRTVFRVEREFDLPARLDRETGARAATRVPLRVVDRIYIDKGAPYLRVRTTVENTVKDHRLRVLFPTELETEKSFAETPFAVVKRPIDIPPETATWNERVNPETAFSRFFGVQGTSFGIKEEECGLAVIAPFGLHEYEVTQMEERCLALTLFRATEQTVGTAGEPDGQLIGTMEFEYLLYPFDGAMEPHRLANLAAEAQGSVYTHHTAELPDDRSFLRLKKGKAVVTAIKPAEDGKGGIVRLWNPGDEDVKDALILDCTVASAELCDLKEAPQEAIALGKDGAIPVIVKAGGLATVRFTWE